MKFELNIEEKEFVNKDNEKIAYFDCSAKIGNETIKFYPKESDKKLLKYLLSNRK